MHIRIYVCTWYSNSQEQQNETRVEMNESDRELQQRIERRMAAIGKMPNYGSYVCVPIQKFEVNIKSFLSKMLYQSVKILALHEGHFKNIRISRCS